MPLGPSLVQLSITPYFIDEKTWLSKEHFEPSLSVCKVQALPISIGCPAISMFKTAHYLLLKHHALAFLVLTHIWGCSFGRMTLFFFISSYGSHSVPPTERDLGPHFQFLKNISFFRLERHSLPSFHSGIPPEILIFAILLSRTLKLNYLKTTLIKSDSRQVLKYQIREEPN